MKYKVAPLNIFGICLLCLRLYVLSKPDAQGWGGLFAIILIFVIIFCIGTDILFQSIIENSLKIWILETILVLILASIFLGNLGT